MPLCIQGRDARATVFFIYCRQIAIRRSLENFSHRVIARAVAGTIPRILQCVPVNYASEVTADRGTLVHCAFRVTIDCNLV